MDIGENRQMKRVIFCLEMPHNGVYIGGIAAIVQQYLNNISTFNNYGFDIRLFDETKCNVTWRLGSKKVKHIVNLLFQIKGVKSCLQDEPNQIIHIHSSIGWTLLKDLVLICCIRKYAKEKIVLSIHFAEQAKILFSNPIIKKFELSIINRYIDNVIFLSKKTRDEFISTGLNPQKAKVLYTFHNFAKIPNIKSVQKEEKHMLKLLFVGSIDKRKGIIDLMETLCEIKDLNYTLDVCGQVNDNQIEERYTMLKKKLGNNVIEHGYVTGEDKRSIFERADILVLPSYGEGLPIVIMEAMATSCAIISTNVGAIPELINTRNGILIESGDREALKQAIFKFSSDPELLEMVKQENAQVGLMFTLDENIRRLCEIYKDLST